MKRQWLVLWSLWLARLVRQPTVPLRISSGLVRGEIVADGSHARYLAIPYATHPAKRFLPPEREPIWEGVFEAIEEHVKCPQRRGNSIFVGQEDCLTLNVYTPLLKPTSPLPVMVFIHGGGFYDGSSSNLIYGPDYLVNKGVILVTVNYRLNLQGYICLRIKEAPGNAGMKDQVAALKWVQRNIKVFGGDPDNVTIFGESAGSASVSYHMLSPMSKGLFHKAILQSGSSLNPWAFQFKPVSMAALLTKVMGYSAKNEREIYDTVMEKSDRDIVMTRVPRLEGNVIVSELLYVPCAEDKIDGVEPFLTELPYDVLTRGEYNKVPIMIGVNNNEGLLFAMMENETTIPKIRFEKSIPKHLHIPKIEEKLEVAKKLDNLYMKGNPINVNTVANLSHFHGEMFITHTVLEETQIYLETNDYPVFSYKFDYYGWKNFLTLVKGYKNATHAEELFYLFRQKILPSFFEDEMINRMTTMWTNFAKYGDPTPSTSELLPIKWHPLNKTLPHSFVIDSEFSTRPLWDTESLRYLREVYKKYRRKKD